MHASTPLCDALNGFSLVKVLRIHTEKLTSSRLNATNDAVFVPNGHAIYPPYYVFLGRYLCECAVTSTARRFHLGARYLTPILQFGPEPNGGCAKRLPDVGSTTMTQDQGFANWLSPERLLALQAVGKINHRRVHCSSSRDAVLSPRCCSIATMLFLLIGYPSPARASIVPGADRERKKNDPGDRSLAAGPSARTFQEARKLPGRWCYRRRYSTEGPMP